jgi:hypothetical protein
MRARLTAAGLALLLVMPGARAAAIGTGPFGFSPHILGRVVSGEADEVARDFAAGLKKPLSVDVDPLSDPLEVARIGLWLHRQRPAVQLKGSCVGVCARAILLSGAVQRIRPGTVIALGGMAEFGLTMKQQLDAGELFIEGDERSQASRQRFMAAFEPAIEQGHQLRALAGQLPQPSQAVQGFVAALTQSWRVQDLSFTDERFEMRFMHPRHACLWWVPDAQGLRQLGLDLPDYQPVSAAQAARLLKVPPSFVYVGPALPSLPEQPLCAVRAGFTLPLLP